MSRRTGPLREVPNYKYAATSDATASIDLNSDDAVHDAEVSDDDNSTEDDDDATRGQLMHTVPGAVDTIILLTLVSTLPPPWSMTLANDAFNDTASFLPNDDDETATNPTLPSTMSPSGNVTHNNDDTTSNAVALDDGISSAFDKDDDGSTSNAASDSGDKWLSPTLLRNTM